MSHSLDAIKGSAPPLITPFNDGAVDYETYGRHVAFHLERSHCILLNGTTSEPAMLTVEERNKTCDTATEVVKGKAPVIVATGSHNLIETRQLTTHAANSGADAILIVTPYYSRPPQRGIVEYYLEATRDVDVPWMIYHIPGRAAVSVTLDTVKELKDRSPSFIGMKHAVNDLGFVSECLDAIPDYKVFVGLEELSYPMMAVGAVGLMNAVGNLCPQELSDMCEAVWAGDMAKGQELHAGLLELNQSVFYDTNPIPLKYMMKRMGLIPENEHRLPMAPATPELEKRLDGVLERVGLI